MNAEYDFIICRMLPPAAGTKTNRWDVQAKRAGGHLGVIKWFGRWRQFCFFPWDDCVFSKGCLADIGDFIEKAMTRQKELKNAQAEEIAVGPIRRTNHGKHEVPAG